MARRLVSVLLAILFAYLALKESRHDSLWSLVYLLISVEYGLDLLPTAFKTKKVARA